MSDNVRAHQERESIMTKTSRFNYIKRGLVGVCAATMLTGLCAGTAFGAVADQESQTAVQLKTADVNISVTVPTSPVAVAVGSNGTFTDIAGGTFTNNSLCGVHVSKIAVAKTADSIMTLKGGTEFGTDTATNNIAKLSATVGSVPLDLASYSTATKPTSAIELGTGATADVKFSGAIKNLTAEAMGAPALDFVTITWTIAADTLPAA